MENKKFDKVDLDSMQGWLTKEKSKQSKFHVFGHEDRRWFKVQKVSASGSTDAELALVYFSSDKSKDAKGWIFLKDISEITDDGDAFKIASYARTMVLQASTRAEHRFWVLNLVKLAINSNYRGTTISAADYASICGSRSSKQPRDSKDEDNELLKFSVEREDKAELKPPPSADSQSGSRSERQKPPLIARKDSREDHRLDDGYLRGGGGQTSSSRLNEHIAGSPRRPSARSRSPANHSARSDSAGSDRGGDLNANQNEAVNTLYDGPYGSHRKSKDDGDDDITSGIQRPSSMDEFHGENDTSDAKGVATDASKPALKKKPLPMPSDPAPSLPRKARDVLASAIHEDGRSSKRPSIDALLAVTDDKRSASTDEDLLGTDFIKEEKRRYQQSSPSILAAAESKDGGLPPRAPKSPSVKDFGPPEGFSSGSIRSSNRDRSSTPPRRGADPGIPVDSNFVDDNWDNDDDVSPTALRRNQGKQAGKHTKRAGDPIGAGVKADDNWLDENFDDD